MHFVIFKFARNLMCAKTLAREDSPEPPQGCQFLAYTERNNRREFNNREGQTDSTPVEYHNTNIMVLGQQKAFDVALNFPYRRPQ